MYRFGLSYLCGFTYYKNNSRANGLVRESSSENSDKMS